MTTYVRLNFNLTRIETFVELTPEMFAAFQVNGKAAALRVWNDVAKPDDTPTTTFDPGPLAVGLVIAMPTWVERPKTQIELDAADLSTERTMLTTAAAMLQTQLDITTAAFNALTAAQKVDVLQADRRIVLRVCRYLIRQALR